MKQKICYIAFITVTVLCVHCGARRRQMKFTRLQPLPSLDGLVCAIERHETARGVKFNTKTNICESLTDAWFLNQIQEADYTYFKVSMTETLFEPNKDMKTGYFPSIFRFGSSIVVYYETGVKYDYHCCIDFKIFNEDMSIIGLSALWQRFKVLVQSYENDKWQYIEASTFTSMVSNRVYKLELFLGQSAFFIKLNDALVTTFSHRVPVSTFRKFEFGNRLFSDGGGAAYVTFLQLQFFHPD